MSRLDCDHKSPAGIAQLAAEAFLDDDHLISREAALLYVAGLIEARDVELAQAAKLEGLRELSALAFSKWLDVTGSVASAWGRAYSEATRELEAKYQPAAAEGE